MRFSVLTAFTLSLSAVATATTTCDANNKCPEDYPCCSDTGVCGTGSYCLGPCDPRYSYNSSACLPAPICKAGTFLPRVDNMMTEDSYLGNTTDTDFIYYGDIADGSDSDTDYLMIKMPKNSTGGIIASTFYVWYGKISMKFKTSHNNGVVSAAILYSQVEDEIDWEFVGYQLETAESNFYFEGLLNYTNVEDLNTTNTYENWHTYEIDWQENSITWSIDGNAMRTVNKADTYNSTSDIYQFPQTPARIEMSIWPVTTESGEGTQSWAGSAIDWDDSDFTDPGYLYIGIDSVEVECYDPPSGTTIDGNVSYIYDGEGFLSKNIVVSDKLTWISNLGGTGFNTGQEEVLEAESSSSAKSSSTSAKSSSTSAKSSSTSAKSSSTSTKSSSSTHSSSATKSSSAPSSKSSEKSTATSTNDKSASTSSKATETSLSEELTSTSSSAETTSSTQTTSSDTQTGFVQNMETLSSSATKTASSTVSKASNIAVNQSPNSQMTLIALIAGLFML